MQDIIRQYAFTYTYMNGSRTGNYTHVFKRLMLTHITDCLDTSIKYDMTYFDSPALPAKNSKNTDYWGYSNGSNQGSDYYCPCSYNGQIYMGANKMGNLTSMRSGTLKSLTYPTGETENFEYETLTSTTAPIPIVRDITASLSAFKRYESDAYEDENPPEIMVTTIKIATSTNFQIWAHLENTTGKGDQSYLYNSETYPLFRVYRLNSDGTKNTDYYYSLIVPWEIETGSEYDFTSYNLILPAGTYSFEVYAPIRDVYVAVYYQYKSTVLNEGETVCLGGLRIKEIHGTDMRSFSYYAGCQLVPPIISYRYDEHYYQDEENHYDYCYLIQSSDPVVSMSTLKDGYNYGYSSVVESRNGGKKMIYNYYNQPEEYDSDYPFIPSTLNCYNGLLMSEGVSQGANFLRKIEYEYSNLSFQNVYGFMYRTNEPQFHTYNYAIEWPCLVNKIETNYENNGNFVKETSYSYNSYFQLKEESFLSDGNVYRTRYVYACDKSGGIFDKMNALHMIGIPIETRIEKGSQVIGAKKTDYQDSDGRVLPTSESRTESQSLLSGSNYVNFYRTITAFGQYSSNANPRSVTTDEGTTVILWGYGGMYPIVVIKGCSYAQVLAILGSSFIDTIENKVQPSSSDLLTLNTLRSSLPEANVTTVTYMPLVGITSITDARGFCTYYTYDASSRLVEEFFMENGIKRQLKKYTYNYHR